MKELDVGIRDRDLERLFGVRHDVVKKEGRVRRKSHELNVDAFIPCGDRISRSDAVLIDIRARLLTVQVRLFDIDTSLWTFKYSSVAVSQLHPSPIPE